MALIIHGPQPCGKTRNAVALAKHFGCSSIVDDWHGAPLPASALALTNFLPESFEAPLGTRVLSFDDAMQLAGLVATSPACV